MNISHLRAYLRVEVESRRRFGLLGTTTDGPDKNPRKMTPPVYYGMADLILQHGQIFTAQKLPPKNRLSSFAKQCFYNCNRAIARKTTPWIYVEGYAWMDGIIMPVHHAWLTHKSYPGIAFDPTWEGNFDDYDPAKTAYLGIAIRREYVIEMFRLSRRQWFSVFDTWWAQYPLLTGKVKIEAVAESLAA